MASQPYRVTQAPISPSEIIGTFGRGISRIDGRSWSSKQSARFVAHPRLASALRLTNSYKTTPAATPTFSESARPLIGNPTILSHMRRAWSVRPSLSSPKTIATGPLCGNPFQTVGAPGEMPTTRTSFCLAQ
jgi:hypothetical protein